MLIKIYYFLDDLLCNIVFTKLLNFDDANK